MENPASPRRPVSVSCFFPHPSSLIPHIGRYSFGAHAILRRQYHQTSGEHIDEGDHSCTVSRSLVGCNCVR